MMALGDKTMKGGKMFDDMKGIRNIYMQFRKDSPGRGIEYLEGLVEYMKYLNMSQEKITLLLGLIMGRLPLTGEKFTDCLSEYNEHEKDFIKRKVDN
jgi:hypothetical protein